METVLYVVSPEPTEPQEPSSHSIKVRIPLPTIRASGPRGLLGFEKFVFGVTRVFALGLALLVVLSLVFAGIGFASTLANDFRRERVTYQEIVDALQIASPRGNVVRGAKAPETLLAPIPEIVRSEFAKKESELQELLEGLDDEQKGRFLENLSVVIGEARKSAIPVDMNAVAHKFKQLWSFKTAKQEARGYERIAVRAGAIMTAFCCLVILALLSIVLVLLAIERNSRHTTTAQ